jgi:hypothetical protein
MTAAPIEISDELQQLVAKQRAVRPELDDAPPPPAREKRIRSQERGLQWQGRVYTAAVEQRAQYSAQAEEIDAELAETLAEGPDFARCHRGSLFLEPPPNCTDRNFLARMMFVANMIERKTWACRKKGKHGGTLGRSALELLRVLLYVVKKHNGRLYPSYDTLALLARMSRATVVKAMKVLVAMGFITLHRRIMRVMTAFGARLVQASNAYSYHLPKTGIGKLAFSVFVPKSSESKKTDASTFKIETRGGSPSSNDAHARGEALKGNSNKEEDRWWLHDPYPTGSGAWR